MSVPSLGDVALHVGVSKMTVSRALRGEPHVSADVRGRILAACEALGYRPDPEIGKLMAHMRRGRRSDSPPTLAFVWAEKTAQEIKESSWSMELIRGARQRAEKLGFHLDEFYLAGKGMTAARLSEILEARGIPGFILSPLVSRSRAQVKMKWERFCSVVVGLGFARPALHRVHHHHFHGMMTAMQMLKKQGHQRIGFFCGSIINERMFGAWSSAFLAHHPLPLAQAEALLCLRREPTLKQFSEWLEAARPEMVIDGGQLLPTLLKGAPLPLKIGQATLAWAATDNRAGIDQEADVLGAAALELLVEQYHHNERGLPANPKIVMTAGQWREAAKCLP
ncbi:MAG: LacI family transcriptional regulator [Verrucomicrobiaceae bacterium]|nr:LacI family transcriptional regulator [Verrucomicrobiaceae bacterium]